MSARRPSVLRTRPALAGVTAATAVVALSAAGAFAVAATSAAPATAPAALPDAVRPAAALAVLNGTTTCTPVRGVLTTTSGATYRIVDKNVYAPYRPALDLAMAPFGTGWRSFGWFGAAGDNVVYALTRTGDLLWIHDSVDVGSLDWTVRTVLTIDPAKVRAISAGTGGALYVLRTDGTLAYYRHTGHLTGAATWADPAGRVIATGWTGTSQLIAAQGDGVVYRQVGGKLLWYRHSDPTAATVTWTAGSGRQIGSGWAFRQLSALGDGVLLATDTAGRVTMYPHRDPVGGTGEWGGVQDRIVTPPAGTFTTSWDPGACAPA